MLGASQKISNSSSGPSPERSEGGVPRPDAEQLRRLLSSPEGQSLLRLLRADGGLGLRAAAEAMRQGNAEGVREALSPLLAGTEAEELTRRLEAKL